MQRGYLFQRGGTWHVRYYEHGVGGTQRRSKVLGYVRDYPTKKDAKPLLEAFMKTVNGSSAPGAGLDDFIQFRYLPYTKDLRPSTYDGYVKLWNARIKGLAEAQMKVFQYRPLDVQRLLDASFAKAQVQGKTLSRRTMQHLKAFLSGAFRYAVLAGVREYNPVQEVRIPRAAAAPKKTYAYSLGEIKRILMLLGDYPAHRAAVAVAGFAGLRLAEIQGLRWEDYDGKDLFISQTIWRGHTSEAKTSASRDYVPVIPSLKAILDEHKASVAPGALMFPSLYKGHEVIVRALAGTGMKWHGWHAFRRGLASNLADMGCSEKLISRILRHAQVVVTREHYIKVRDPKLEEAMLALDNKIGPLGSAWLRVSD